MSEPTNRERAARMCGCRVCRLVEPGKLRAICDRALIISDELEEVEAIGDASGYLRGLRAAQEEASGTTAWFYIERLIARAKQAETQGENE